MLMRFLPLLAVMAPYAFADVQFTSPSAGATVAGGTTLDVEWEDSGDKPPISQMTTYELFLCAGGNDEDNFVQLAPIATQGKFSTGDSASGTVQLNVGGSDKNAYFLKMVSAAPGGTVINYSDRFTLSGMTGSFPPKVQAAIKDIEDTKGPDTQNNINEDGEGPAAAGGADGKPYSMQTGPTKYAPMQKKPGTKITKKNPTPLYPTSSAKIAKAALPTPVQVTTMTMSVTYSVTSMENTASPLPGPNANMQKFLNRWRD